MQTNEEREERERFFFQSDGWAGSMAICMRCMMMWAGGGAHAHVSSACDGPRGGSIFSGFLYSEASIGDQME